MHTAVLEEGEVASVAGGERSNTLSPKHPLPPFPVTSQHLLILPHSLLLPPPRPIWVPYPKQISSHPQPPVGQLSNTQLWTCCVSCPGCSLESWLPVPAGGEVWECTWLRGWGEVRESVECVHFLPHSPLLSLVLSAGQMLSHWPPLPAQALRPFPTLKKL